MKLSILILSLLPTTCFANNLVPSINEVPALWGMLGNDPRYYYAAFKAQEAFFVQSGFTTQYNTLTGYASDRITVVAKIAERKTAAAIDMYTPLSSRHVFFAVALSYTAIVKKEITRGFRNPLFHNVSHTITVGQHGQSLGVQIPF